MTRLQTPRGGIANGLPSAARFYTYTVLALAACALGAMPLRPGIVVGESMEPTFHTGDAFAYSPVQPDEALRRGEVVLVKLQGRPAIKRVFALGGDRFWNLCAGSGMDRSPCLVPPGTPIAVWQRRFPELRFRPRRVPPGRIFVLGDGLYSQDSRQLGPVLLEDVIGRVVLPAGPASTQGITPACVWKEPPGVPSRPSRHV